MALKRKTKPTKSGRTVSVDFSDVGEGGGFRIPPGEYTVKVEEVTQETSSNDNPMLSWILKGVDGKAKGKTFYYNTSLLEQSLWKLREMLVGLGVEVPEEVMDIELDELEGLEGVAVVDDDTYQGKTRSRIVSFAEGEAAEAEPERPARGNSKGKKAAKVSEEEVSEMAEDDLESLIERTSIEVDLGDYKTLSKKRAAVISALEEAKLLEG